MKSILSALLFGWALTLLSTAPALAEGKPAAVLFHADWCLNCKLMKPRLAALQQEYGDQVDFIRVDYTTDAARAEGKKLAKSRGFAKLYNENRATGWVALLAADGAEAGTLHVTMEDAEMRRALDDLVASN